MSITKYFLGFAKHIYNRRISKLSLIDSKSLISRKARVYYKAKVYMSSVGAYTYIGPRTSLVHTNIGKFCSVASDCSIGLASHSIDYLSTSPIFTSKNNATNYRWVEKNSYDEFDDVWIGNDVWIGIKVIIKGGVKIGSGAVIGAGAIVTKDVPEYAIVAGVPARVISYRFDELSIKKLLELKWWDFPETKLVLNIDIFNKKSLTIEELQRLEN